ncbi:DUF6519 domain-containing protein [Streptomyces capitiformicae]|uniref:Uncharacterized protein n=1 Tax=Streptomyces capitiformicae TaxID=2014920 RepID=A0A919GII3_9ACTN|nr:DUF6519 domain-containing protein [Streptomyces capitiformicae]GHH85432.1 hypothetical protein GCM10017771_18270 [Streptomyces capitiformicae]
MKGDFTRRTFRSGNHYRGVLMQQGRVQLDADWNEQLDIQLHHDETTARDAIGAHGGPRGAAGFAITDPKGADPRDCPPEDLWLSLGRYYVDGILCENDNPVQLENQPDLPELGLPDADGRFVAYLDVWREHLTALERPELREVALGGPDTGTRSRTVWQVRLEQMANPEATPDKVAQPWKPRDSRTRGQLRARAQPPEAGPTPGVVPPHAGYRRVENQLYRVEIHEGSDGSPSFVWSRDNGTVAARLVGWSPQAITVDSPGRDEALGFSMGQWVEVTNHARTRRGEHGALAQLGEVSGTELKVVHWVGNPLGLSGSPGAVVRRWDSPGAVPITGDWIELEDGVQVQFEPGAFHRTGDYWLIPARTAALSLTDLDSDIPGNVEWPRGEDGVPVYQLPDGIKHHTAAIALLDRVSGLWTRVSDYRALFAPLAAAAPGLHVKHVRLLPRKETNEMDEDTNDGELGNDTSVATDDFLRSFVVVGFDDVPAPVPATDQSVLTVTLDLPYPLSPAERDAWRLPPGQFLGTQSFDLAGVLKNAGSALRWIPDLFLVKRLQSLLLDKEMPDRIRCRLTLNGRALTAKDHPDRLLNGLALTRPRPDGTTEVVLPTVDDVRGADFTFWFWIERARVKSAFDDSTFDENVFS